MEMIKKKKGFTLIELMIVLAIIAILAIVLIPKAGIFKNQSKNAGVTTNVNTVRAYLETKTSDSSGAGSYLSSTALINALNSAFSLSGSGTNDNGTTTGALQPSGSSTNEQLINPFDKNSASIFVRQISTNGIIPGVSSPYNVALPNTILPGEVVVEVYSDGYIIYGIDNSKNPTEKLIVK